VSAAVDTLKAKIRDVPDFPKPGIVFKDIMPLIGDAEGLRTTVDLLAEWAAPREPDIVLGAEARGYITGGALACKLGCGFVAARKPGKLPWRTVAAKYALEYGFDTLEVHADSITPGQRVLIHDDGRHGEGDDRPRRAARGGGRRPPVHHRADVPGRARPPRRLRRLLAHRVLNLV
jgi:adenine phosphoribosyltransferase